MGPGSTPTIICNHNPKVLNVQEHATKQIAEAISSLTNRFLRGSLYTSAQIAPVRALARVTNQL